MQSSKTRNLALCAIFTALIVVMTVTPYTGYINYGLFVEITTLHIVVILGSVALGWRYGAVLGGAWGVTCLARAFTNPAWALFTNPLISVVPRIIVGLVAGALYGLLRKKMGGRTATPHLAAVVGLFAGGLIFAALSFGQSGEGAAAATWPIAANAAVGLAAAAGVAILFFRLGRRYASGSAYAAAVTALVASLTHTTLVLTAMFLFGGMLESTRAFYELFKTIVGVIVGVNGAIELLAAVLITPVLTLAVIERGRKSQEQ